MAGWFKMYRSIENHWIFDDADHLRAWIYILTQAAYTATDRMVQGTIIRLNAGELVASERYLQEKLKWNSRGKVRRFLKLLEKAQMLNHRTDQKQTILCVAQWQEYQGDTGEADQQPANKRTSDEPRGVPDADQTRTNIKKENNFKKKRNKEIPPIPPEGLSPVVDGCEFFRMNAHEKALVEAYYLDNGFHSDLIRYAIKAVEAWLTGNSTKAYKARNNPTHYRYLYEAWALENAHRARQVATNSNRPVNLRTSVPAPSRAQHTQNLLDQMLDEARAKEARAIQQPDDKVRLL